MAETRNARRWFLEPFVIVSSILLAFGIDAAWDERQERAEEAEIIAGLQREFTGYRDVLEARVELHAEILSAASVVLASIEAGDWTSTEWTVDEAIGRLLSPPTTDLGNGVRDALVQGGRLELLSDLDLRERLARWPGFYQEALDDEVFSRNLVFELLIPYLTERGVELSAALIRGTMPLSPEGVAVWPVEVGRIDADPGAVRRLLADPEFKAVVSVRYAYWHHAGGEYRAALGAAEEILGMLESRP